MSLVEINWNPNRKELRNFAITALIASALIALLLYIVKGLEINWVLIILALGLAVFLSGMISARLTRLIYLGLVLAVMPIGLLVSFVLLAAFFFLLLTPIGLLFRLLGRDPLRRRFDSNANTYWIVRRAPDNVDRYFHQF